MDQYRASAAGDLFLEAPPIGQAISLQLGLQERKDLLVIARFIGEPFVDELNSAGASRAPVIVKLHFRMRYMVTALRSYLLDSDGLAKSWHHSTTLRKAEKPVAFAALLAATLAV